MEVLNASAIVAKPLLTTHHQSARPTPVPDGPEQLGRGGDIQRVQLTHELGQTLRGYLPGELSAVRLGERLLRLFTPRRLFPLKTPARQRPRRVLHRLDGENYLVDVGSPVQGEDDHGKYHVKVGVSGSCVH